MFASPHDTHSFSFPLSGLQGLTARSANFSFVINYPSLKGEQARVLIEINIMMRFDCVTWFF
jgi:hypothetical protein